MNVQRIRKIVVLLSESRMEVLNESKKTRGEPARKDSPHFPSDLTHAHKKLPGGFEVAWDVVGNRRHPTKFPDDDKIPHAAKAEIAQLLKVNVSVLESYRAFDSIEGEEVFIITEKPLAVQLTERLRSLS